MKTKAFTLFLFCSIAWLCFGCCKSETYYVDQEVKDFTVFQPGSWWVYVDSVSGRRDSVVVTRIQNFFDHEEGDNCKDQAETLSVVTSVFYRDTSADYIAYDYTGENIERDYIQKSGVGTFSPYSGIWANRKGTLSKLGHFDRGSGSFPRGAVYDTLIDNIMSKAFKFTSPELSYVYVKKIGIVMLTNKYYNQEIYLIRYATT